MRSFRLRYSLRTFLVVIALAACWLGYHLRIINQRRVMLAWVVEQGGEYHTYHDSALLDVYSPSWMCTPITKIPSWIYENKEAQVSDFRTWLGDAPIYFINLMQPAVTNKERTRVAAMFPEAQVTINDPGQMSPQEKQEILKRMRAIDRSK